VATGTTIGIGSTRLGRILIDGKGRTLYLFVADSGTRSACNSSACVQYWPPVLTTGAPQAGSGLNGSLRRNHGGHVRRPPSVLLHLRQEGG
jgi:predicted lipoprotein with Yx(FWY)xxD motif